VPSATLAPAGLEHKAASTSPESGLIEADDATGVVEAIVSVTGLLDEDRDVIKPGAYAKTLAKRRPKGIFVHDWAKWVARTEHIEELMPGDSRLPTQTKDGRPWPREAGGLYVKARFNLATREGRDAYENVKFFSETGEAEWSIGYKVPPGKSVRTKSGERHIEEVDLYEYSPVLFGAAPLSGTLSVKSAGADAPEDASDAPEDILQEYSWEELEEASGQAEPLEDDDEAKALFDLSPPPMSDSTMRDRVHAALFRLDQALAEGKRSEAEAQLDIILSVLRGVKPDPAILAFTDGALRVMRANEGSVQGERGPGAYEHIGQKSDDWDAESKRMGTGLDRSPKKNWVENTGRLPAYIEEIAKSIHEKRGLPLEQAIPIAIATVKKWAAGGGDVEPDTRAKAAKAVSEWEALKARNAAREKGISEDMESAHFPHLPGTYEELREALRDSAAKALSALSTGVTHVEVMGTWPDRAVVTAYRGDGKALSYELDYTAYSDGEKSLQVEVGEPAPVELTVSVDGNDEDSQSLLPYPSMIGEASLGLKALLSFGETKAGRVLSAVNEKRLLAAVESLVAVLQAAGLEVDASARTEQEQEDRDQAQEAYQYQDSTAPSARAESKVVLDQELLKRARLVVDEEEKEEEKALF
jgi:phage head maturation protease